MIDLPELELDEHYYLKLKNGKVEVQKFIGGFVLRNDDEIDEVLAKVPSYEQWQRALHYAGKYEFEYTSCVMDYEKLKEENAQFKAVLKECYLINEMAIHTFNWLETIVTPSQKHICPKVVGGINRTQQSIKQALGEE